jgi:hypothetical protein
MLQGNIEDCDIAHAGGGHMPSLFFVADCLSRKGLQGRLPIIDHDSIQIL